MICMRMRLVEESWEKITLLRMWGKYVKLVREISWEVEIKNSLFTNLTVVQRNLLTTSFSTVGFGCISAGCDFFYFLFLYKIKFITQLVGYPIAYKDWLSRFHNLPLGIMKLSFVSSSVQIANKLSMDPICNNISNNLLLLLCKDELVYVRIN